jgi:hypothetical protein
MKLDRRYTGYSNFKYAVAFRYKEAPLFLERREWMWEQFGPSCEYEFWKDSRQTCWCWINDNYRTRILFESEKEYNWYMLKWG